MWEVWTLFFLLQFKCVYISISIQRLHIRTLCNIFGQEDTAPQVRMRPYAYA